MSDALAVTMNFKGEDQNVMVRHAVYFALGPYCIFFFVCACVCVSLAVADFVMCIYLLCRFASSCCRSCATSPTASGAPQHLKSLHICHIVFRSKNISPDQAHARIQELKQSMLEL